MKTYIEKLNKENKEKELARAFKNEFLNIKVQYTYENCFYGELILRREFEDDVVLRVYHLTDFTCNVVNAANLDYRSALEFSDSKVRKIYISFMNKTFPNYRDDYLNATCEQAKRDLGETI